LNEVELQAKEFEKNSSLESSSQASDSADTVKQWIQCLRMKKALVTKIDRLKNELRELQLQERQAELHKQLRTMKLDTTMDGNKFEVQRDLTEQITEIVYQRDRLVKQIHELREEEALNTSTLSHNMSNSNTTGFSQGDSSYGAI